MSVCLSVSLSVCLYTLFSTISKPIWMCVSTKFLFAHGKFLKQQYLGKLKKTNNNNKKNSCNGGAKMFGNYCYIAPTRRNRQLLLIIILCHYLSNFNCHKHYAELYCNVPPSTLLLIRFTNGYKTFKISWSSQLPSFYI